MRITLLVLFSLAIIGASIGIYWRSNYSDKIITNGDGFGISIGDSKEEALKNLETIYIDSSVYFFQERPIDFNVTLEALAKSDSIIMQEDVWTFYFHHN